MSLVHMDRNLEYPQDQKVYNKKTRKAKRVIGFKAELSRFRLNSELRLP